MDDDTKKIMMEILTTLKGLDNRVARLEDSATLPVTATAQDGVTSGKKLSIKEFIINRAPSNGVQMTLTIAYYLEVYEGVSPINAADLEKGFRAAREAVPKNINDKVNMCVTNGHLMEEKDKKESMKAWVVTRSGEDLVRKGFGKTQS
ncbi:MAG: hypothetical protein Q7S95_02535 [bacterium]|nr:hypothetical protein [bacterium]